MKSGCSTSFLCLLLIGCWPVAGFTTDSQSTQIFGSNPALAEGARALQMRNYETGLELTSEGLESPLSKREKSSAYSNLCAALIGLQRYSEALESCDEALKLNSRNWRVYNNRALALLGVGQVAAARESLEKGIVLNPDSVTLSKVAAMIEERVQQQLLSETTHGDTQFPQPVVISD